jgi:hypothetical protein
MSPFHREPKQLGTLALRGGYASSATRNERALGVLLWTALFVLLLLISR